MPPGRVFLDVAMAGSETRVEWDKAAISDLLKNDEGIREALMEHGKSLAKKNSADILAKMHSPVNVQPYVAEHRVLRHTQVVVVHSTTKAVAAAGRANGYPRH